MDGLIPVDSGQMPLLLDDSAREDLGSALDKSLAAMKNIADDQKFNLCGGKYSGMDLRRAMQRFKQGIEKSHDDADLQNFIFDNFTICQAAGVDNKASMLVTGYYEPFFKGSLLKKYPYIYPLYRVPEDLISRKGEYGEQKIGRLENGQLLPYWTRAEIAKKNILHGQEVVYLADPVSAFVLHVQGSGKIEFPDGKVARVFFAGSNGRQYRSIGKFMVERGIMTREEVTMPKIVEYLQSHPDESEDILHHNDRFIFFGLSMTEEDEKKGPFGSLGQALTPGRSVALDTRCFPVPMAGFLETEQPVFNGAGEVAVWEPMHRFVLNQDTGAAIKGPGRVDLFFGSGQSAEKTAGFMKQPGKLYFFLPKE